ncbi:hypothetical protein E2C01_033722 [Portunus trituberculatus]|uniref:Immunoglobulin-like beta-sandwich domain-containing protein n=1 Tax=Portunus trituberculatus TaxID=210409 RepID=A0A5B7F3N2_PORTR|nr:hypothetical protein [Portunus trituberculatus]
MSFLTLDEARYAVSRTESLGSCLLTSLACSPDTMQCCAIKPFSGAFEAEPPVCVSITRRLQLRSSARLEVPTRTQLRLHFTAWAAATTLWMKKTARKYTSMLVLRCVGHMMAACSVEATRGISGDLEDEYWGIALDWSVAVPDQSRVFRLLITNLLDRLHHVAWIAFDKSAILTVQEHVITRNPRVNVTYDGHRTWTLHLSRVNATDAGTYMCQVNTIVAKSQFGILNVKARHDSETLGRSTAGSSSIRHPTRPRTTSPCPQHTALLAKSAPGNTKCSVRLSLQLPKDS